MYLIGFSFATDDAEGGRRIYGSTMADISLVASDLKETLIVLQLAHGNRTKIHNVDYLPTEEEHPGDVLYCYYMIFHISYGGFVDTRHRFKVLPNVLRTISQLRQLELDIAAELYAQGDCPVKNVELVVALTACKPAHIPGA